MLSVICAHMVDLHRPGHILYVLICIGNISTSKDDDQLSSSVIITTAVDHAVAVLLILVILVVALSIYILRRCRRHKQCDVKVGNDYNSKER